MKKLLFYLSFIIVILMALSTGCKKDNDTPTRKNYAWAVGAQDSTTYGMILFSNDGGDTWTRQGGGSQALKGIDVEDVWALDENNVWAVCSENVILKTTDGGQTWTRVQAQDIPGNPELMCISIVDKNNIWISGANGVVYNSTDGGYTWVLYDTSFFHKGLMQGICAVNSQMVYVAGGINAKKDMIGFIAFTLDGGTTWDSIVLADNYNKHEWIDVTSSGADHIVVYGCKSHYAFTTDGGATWKNDSLITGGVGGADINHLKMLDEQTWWGAFDLDGIYITKDGGTSWIQQQSAGPGNMFLVGIDNYDDQLALIVGQSAGWPPEGKIIKTSNGGNLWELKYHCNSPLYKISFIKE
ncbi:MAG: YCF48-related protein [Bacteroidetes bacterium]|nr:YCF48-related protein [Bacteroidota bacterium]